MKLACAMIVPLLLACGDTAADPPPPPQTTPPPSAAPTGDKSVEQAEQARQALVDWFECEECEEGQLQAVVKQGQAVVPLLRSALLQGASPASRELLRRELAKRYDELKKNEQKHSYAKLGSDKEQFIASNVDNLNAQYQVRAAQALAAIGGPAAVRALEEGARKTKRADVRATIKKALSTAKK